MPRRSILLLAGACIAIAAALALVTIFVVTARDKQGQAVEVASTGQPLIGGPFQLVDQDGRAVDESLLNGKWSLVFFGFTYCPEFCPTTLASLAATETALGDKADDLQTVFISVDPERDTPQAIKDYLSSDGFPQHSVGLTGTPDQIASVAREYRAFYQKVGEGEGYTMDHSLTVYLMGPDGKFRSAVAYDLGPEKTAQLIERVMARG